MAESRLPVCRCVTGGTVEVCGDMLTRLCVAGAARIGCTQIIRGFMTVDTRHSIMSIFQWQLGVIVGGKRESQWGVTCLAVRSYATKVVSGRGVAALAIRG